MIKYCSMQESLRRKDLLETMELRSSGHDEQVKRAFAQALEMQQTSTEEAANLKAELKRTVRSNQEKIDALLEQVMPGTKAVSIEIIKQIEIISEHGKLWDIFISNVYAGNNEA